MLCKEIHLVQWISFFLYIWPVSTKYNFLKKQNKNYRPHICRFRLNKQSKERQTQIKDERKGEDEADNWRAIKQTNKQAKVLFPTIRFLIFIFHQARQIYWVRTKQTHKSSKMSSIGIMVNIFPITMNNSKPFITSHSQRQSALIFMSVVCVFVFCLLLFFCCCYIMFVRILLFL